MADQHRSHGTVHQPDVPFTASVVPDADTGGWLSVIVLGDGASVSRWFEEEEQARRYPVELASWLARKQRTSDAPGVS